MDGKYIYSNSSFVENTIDKKLTTSLLLDILPFSYVVVIGFPPPQTTQHTKKYKFFSHYFDE